MQQAEEKYDAVCTMVVGMEGGLHLFLQQKNGELVVVVADMFSDSKDIFSLDKFFNESDNFIEMVINHMIRKRNVIIYINQSFLEFIESQLDTPEFIPLKKKHIIESWKELSQNPRI